MGLPTVASRSVELMLWTVLASFTCSGAATVHAQPGIADDFGRDAQRTMPTRGGKALRIEWERTGGFAGMRMAATIDSASLSDEEAGRLSELVEAAGFFDLPENIGGPETGGADRFLYTLTVETEGRRHTVHASEAAAEPALRSLIRWLTNVARKGRRRGGSP